MRKNVLRRILEFVYRFCGWCAGLLLIAICTIMLLMSVGREIGIALRGGDELVAWASTACFALGLAYTFRQGEMVRVGLLIERLQGRARRLAELGCLLIGTFFTGALAYYCADFVWDAYRLKDVTPGVLVLPLWIPQFSLALGTLALFVAFLEQLVLCLVGIKPDYAKDPPRTEAEILERAASNL
jgi:TRAP-type C4-dicarboxylate transport system permease small subunit